MKLLTHSETALEMGLGVAQMRTDRKAGAMPSASLLGRNWVYPPECIAEYRAWREQQEWQRPRGRPRKGVRPATAQDVWDAVFAGLREMNARKGAAKDATEEEARAAWMRVFAAPEERA